MKTMCALMVVVVVVLGSCCCLGVPRAVKISTSPGTCCFNVSEQALSASRVVDITKTHSSCPTKAFIVKTVKGRRICYNRTFEWAQNLFDVRHPGQ